MRRAPTRGEATPWAALRGCRLGPWKFRRQHVIAGYIVDFYCAELALAIEVDGEVHDTQCAEDASRDRDLRDIGVRVVRVRDLDVVTALDHVVQSLITTCQDIAGAGS